MTRMGKDVKRRTWSVECEVIRGLRETAKHLAQLNRAREAVK